MKARRIITGWMRGLGWRMHRNIQCMPDHDVYTLLVALESWR